jgi:GTPase SAR1 family protein
MTLADAIYEFDGRLDRLEQDLRNHYGETFRPPHRERSPTGVPEDLLTLGLVGGTGVGKSSIVNALAGRDVSRTSARRPTTARAIPYLHIDRLDALADMSFIRDHLSEDRITHEIPELRSLALFDLPDIDSRADEHGDVVSAAAEGLDLVVWIASLTKYSDREFHDWIRARAAGVDLDNAVFVINKIDRIDAGEGAPARKTLRDRFADTLIESLGLDPSRKGDLRIFLVSTLLDREVPGNEFEALRSEIFRERDAREIARIKASNRLAEADRRLAHMETFLALDERRGRLDEEVKEARAELDQSLDELLIAGELERIIETSPVPGALADIHYRRSVKSWPLLPRLTFLAAPLRRSFKILRQLQRLAGLDGGIEDGAGEAHSPLLGALESVQHARRRHRSRRASLATELPFSPKDRAEMERDLRRFRTECDEALGKTLEERRRVDSGSVSAPRWWRYIVVFAPLLWFPFLQPLVQESLDPNAGSAPLLHRLAFRLAQVAGATHLMVSLLFVALVYAIIILMLRGIAWRRASQECRRVLESDSWRDVMKERLESIALEDLEDERRRIDSEGGELRALRAERSSLRERVGA